MGIILWLNAASVKSVQVNESAEYEIGVLESIQSPIILFRVLQHDTQNGYLIVSVSVKISHSSFRTERKVYVVPLLAVSGGTVFRLISVKRLHILFGLESSAVPFVGLDVNFSCIAHEHTKGVGKGYEVVI